MFGRRKVGSPRGRWTRVGIDRFPGSLSGIATVRTALSFAR